MIKKSSQPYVFLFYFGCLLFLGLVVRDINEQPYLSANIQNFMSAPNLPGMSDPISFASGAIDVFQNGWFSPDTQWLINLWPPGFMLLEALILKLFGLEAPFITILIVLSSLFSAVMLILMRKYLSDIIHPIAATLLPLLPFCFPVTRLFILQPIGAILGENFSIIFFITAVLLLILGFRERSIAKAIMAGTMLALSAYFRSQFEVLIIFLTAGAAPILIWCLIQLWRQRVTGPKKAQIHLTLWIVLVTLITAHVLMFPWRLKNLSNPSSPRLSWVVTDSLIYRNAGLPDKDLLEISAGWIVQGGGNLACTLEPSYCGKADKALYYQAFLKHAGQWYLRKFALLDTYWFSSLHNFTSIVYPSTYGDNVASLLFLFCVLATWPLLWMSRYHAESVLHIWVYTSFYACFFVVFTFVQFEVRYFYLMKIFSVFSTIMLACLVFQLRKTKTSNYRDNLQKNSPPGQ